MNVTRHSKSALRRVAAAAALVLAFTQPALAQGEFAVGGDGARVSASATVAFRIVVREDLRFDNESLGAQQQRRKLHMPQVQRLVAALDGRQQVTMSAP